VIIEQQLCLGILLEYAVSQVNLVLDSIEVILMLNYSDRAIEKNKQVNGVMALFMIKKSTR
jgi:hypothetical protein